MGPVRAGPRATKGILANVNLNPVDGTRQPSSSKGRGARAQIKLTHYRESFQTIEQLRFIANLTLENHRASLAGTETAYSKWEGEKHVLVRELVTTSKREIAVSALAGACRAKGRVILIDIEWPKRNNAATEEALKLMVSASKSLNFEQ